jgi:hypothetical protein
MYLDIHTLEIANGLKDALIHSGFTIESIPKHGPRKLPRLWELIRMLQRPYLMLPRKPLNLIVLCKNKITILSNCLMPCDF